MGEVALDDPDITDRLAWLRKTAAGLAQGAVTTKLVIPNSEILYDRIELKKGSAEKREAQLRGALDGRTPYPVDQLAYDYVVEGDIAKVAVVARETLVEAEAFATEHRFNPICFVAIPPSNTVNEIFDGEPMFGTTSAAKALLDPSDPVERDATPILIVGSANLPDLRPDAPVVDVAEELSAPEVEAELPSEKGSASEPLPNPVGRNEYGALDAEAVAAGLVMAGLPGKQRESDPDPEQPSEDTPVAAPDAADQTDSPRTDRTEPKRGEKTAAPLIPPAALEALSSGTPALDAMDGDDSTITPSEPAADQAAPADSAPAAPSFFASRRVRDPSELRKPEAPIPPQAPATRLRTRRSRLGFGLGADAPSTDADAAAAPAEPARKEPRFGGFRRAEPAAPKDTSPAGTDTVEPDRAPSEATEPSEPAAPIAAPLIPEGKIAAATTTEPLSNKPPARGEPSPAALARLSAIVPNRRVKPDADAKDAAQVSQVADAPSPELMGVRGAANPAPEIKKPLPIGLILTGALLAILLLGAIALMLFVEGDEQAMLTPEAASELTDLEINELAQAALVPQPRLNVPDAATEASLPPAVAVNPDELDDAELADAEPNAPEALIEPELPSIDDDFDTPDAPVRVTLVEAEARYAATGIWMRSPDPLPQPVIVGLEDLYLASLDPDVGALDAVALPGYVQGRDLRLSTPRPAVGPGLTFDLDENGLVTPSAEGTLNPQGVRVRLPDGDTLRPLPRPRTEAPETEAAAPDANALAAVRPRARPENASELLERAALDGFSRAELAALRPKPRPESEQAIASAAAIAARASTAAVLTDDDDETGETAAAAVFSDSELAVASSRNPTLRPSNIAQIVATARATPQPQATRVAAVRSNTPQIPTRASVARQATIEDGISLRRVNLIGVFGSPSDRRAIVRLANGNHVKVVVGDRVDGGQVAAIGESSLQYVKSGRNLTLSLPSGG